MITNEQPLSSNDTGCAPATSFSSQAVTSSSGDAGEFQPSDASQSDGTLAKNDLSDCEPAKAKCNTGRVAVRLSDQARKAFNLKGSVDFVHQAYMEWTYRVPLRQQYGDPALVRLYDAAAKHQMEQDQVTLLKYTCGQLAKLLVFRTAQQAHDFIATVESQRSPPPPPFWNAVTLSTTWRQVPVFDVDIKLPLSGKSNDGKPVAGRRYDVTTDADYRAQYQSLVEQWLQLHSRHEGARILCARSSGPAVNTSAKKDRAPFLLKYSYHYVVRGAGYVTVADNKRMAQELRVLAQQRGLRHDCIDDGIYNHTQNLRLALSCKSADYVGGIERPMEPYADSRGRVACGSEDVREVWLDYLHTNCDDEQRWIYSPVVGALHSTPPFSTSLDHQNRCIEFASCASTSSTSTSASSETLYGHDECVIGSSTRAVGSNRRSSSTDGSVSSSATISSLHAGTAAGCVDSGQQVCRAKLVSMKQLVDMLDTTRRRTHAHFVTIGFIAFNEGVGLELWDHFCRRFPDLYDRASLEKKWLTDIVPRTAPVPGNAAAMLAGWAHNANAGVPIDLGGSGEQSQQCRVGLRRLKQWAQEDSPVAFATTCHSLIAISELENTQGYLMDMAIKLLVKDHYRFVPPPSGGRGSGGIWYCWNPETGLWCDDFSGAHFQQSVRVTLRGAIAQRMKLMSEGEREHGMKTAVQCMRMLQTGSHLDSIGKLCRLHFCDRSFVEMLDSHAHLLAFTNGVYDLQSDCFRPLEPDDYVSMSVGYAYEPAESVSQEDRKAVDDFWRQVFPKSLIRHWYLTAVATCLHAHNEEQVVVIQHGIGANGKSVGANFIQATLGDYARPLDPNLLLTQRVDSGRAQPELFHALKRRFVVMVEPSDHARFNSSLLKALSGGEKIAVRPLYGAPVCIEPHFTMFMLCNTVPENHDSSDGTRRRTMVIPHRSCFKDAPKAEHHFPMDNNVSAHFPQLRLAFLHRLLALYREHRLSGLSLRKRAPQEIVDFTRVQIEPSTPYDLWMRDYLTQDDWSPEKHGRLTIQNIRKRFGEWLYAERVEHAGVVPSKFKVQLKCFQDKLRQYIAEEPTKSNQRVQRGSRATTTHSWVGWRIRTDAEVKGDDCSDECELA